VGKTKDFLTSNTQPSPGLSLPLQLYPRRRNQLPEEKFRQGMPGRCEAENPGFEIPNV
jgi:hypothetical protein